MNDTEEAVRRLFTVAAEDVPPGIDLLRGVRARSRARVVRVRALAAAGAAGIVGATAAITLSAAPAPSAFAQVTRAAARTAATSYRISATNTMVNVGGLRSQPWAAASGEFDPVHGVGEQTDNLGAQFRYVGGYLYVYVTDDLRAASHVMKGTPIPDWASWERIPAPLQRRAGVSTTELGMLGIFPGGLRQLDPQGLLAMLESATGVREVGPASGPGWTGSAYAFNASTHLIGPLDMPISSSGTVDVDQQGRVRQLDATETFNRTVQKVEITFGDFGLPVSVSAPPASETFTG